MTLDIDSLENHVRERRLKLGISQQELAAAAGVSRQALNAIEAGRSVPGTRAALMLARALACRVEDLFGLADDGPVDVEATGATSPGARVVVGRIGDRTVAHALSGEAASPEAFSPADGVVEGDGVRLFSDAGTTQGTVLIAGCDPSIPTLALRTNEARRDGRVTWLHATSMDALRSLREGTVHLAGCHIPQADGEDGNLAEATRALEETGGTVLTYAAWEQGIVVPKGNPKSIRSAADLAGRARIINRERGSGSRMLLDAELERAGVAAGDIAGYENETTSHIAVARTVAMGAADAGIGLRAAAESFGLGFVPLRQVRFDLVVPQEALAQPMVSALLEVLQSKALRAELRTLPGYDTALTGSTVARIAPAA